jgi:hypothetical protein
MTSACRRALGALGALGVTQERGDRTMANSFSLTRRIDLDNGPVSLRQVDEEICAHFKIVPHPKDYYHAWFDTIGFELTTGRSFTDIIRRCQEDMKAYPENYKYYKRKLDIAEYLDKNFISDRWSWEIRTIKESTEDKFRTVLEQLDQLLSDPARMDFFEKKLNDQDEVFIERVAELSMILDRVFEKHPGLRERYAESFRERFGKLTNSD